MIRFTSIGESEILLADAVMTVPSPSLNLPPVDCRVTSKVSVSSPVLVHTGCNHESRLSGIAVLGTDPKADARVLGEEAGVVAVGAEVSVASDVDPQAMTASMIARQDVIRTLWNIIIV
jgi:hypothetical protein